MAELTGVPIPSIDWKSTNLPEALRKFKRTCEFIFDGPLAGKGELIKVQYLMLWVGDTGRDIRDGWGLTDANKQLLAPHWDGFDNYVKPKSNFRVARFTLRALKQEEIETVDAFITRAKLIADECEFTDKQEQLLDTLIAGLHSDTIRRKLIAKDKDLTLDAALRIVRAYEGTQRQMNAIEGTKSIQAVKYSRPRPKPNHKPKYTHCLNCGEQHDKADTCPAANEHCFYCKKPGHRSKACFKKKKDGKEKSYKSYNKQHKKRVHQLDNTTTYQGDEDDTDDNFILDSLENEVNAVKTNTQAYANIKMAGDTNKTVRCKLDSGAEVNVMPMRIFRQLFPSQIDGMNKPTHLHKSSAKLIAYGDNRIKVYGTKMIKCTHGETLRTLNFHITEDDGKTMLSLNTCLDLQLMTLNCIDTSICFDCHKKSDISEISSSMKFGQKGNAKEDLLSQYKSCFQGVGLFPGEYHIDLQENAEPVIHPPRRVPESLKAALQKELQRMTDMEIIEKVEQPTDWVNSIVYVTKPTGELRICLDPKDLNQQVKRPHYYTQTLDDVLPKLQGSTLFTILDARSGYWNVKLDDASKLLTTFNTPYGRYCFKRLPFGLVSAQDVFKKKVDQTFEGLPGVIAIADDIVVFGKDELTHDTNLKRVMDRTMEVGLKLNPNKCVVKSQRIKFFGNYLTHKGLEPDPNKVSSITEMAPPTNVAQLQSLLGLANYLGRFTPNLATITSTLRDLTKKDVIFSWGPEHQAAFKKLKDTISAKPTLAYFDPKKTVTVQTDASMQGLGATLMQNGQPVAYASKSLTDTERNYCNIEREMLGIVFGLERFHHYVYGRHVTIESDHKPLEAITKKHLKNAPPRLMRMLLRIQKYDFTVKYIPGRDIPVADGLSRLPVKGEEIKDIDITIHDIACVTTSRLEKIKHATQQDTTLNILTHVIAKGWPETRSKCPNEAMPFWNFRDELANHNGVILKGNRVIIPKNMQKEVLEKIHVGHQGIEKCRLRARDSVFWCGINSDIDEMVKSCSACQHNQVAQQKEPLIAIEANTPWDIIGSDLFHWNGHEYLLVVDYYSSYIIIRKLTSLSSQAIISKLKLIFSEFGIPNTVISDNGKQYDSEEFRLFANTYNFEHTTSSPRYPQCNGKAERFVGITKKALEKSHEAGDDPALALLCLRTTPIEAGMLSPAELMFGRKVQANLPVISTNKTDLKKSRSTKWHQNYNRHAKPLKDLHNGQSVRVQDYKTKKWKPAIIDGPSGKPRSYLLTTSSGAQYRRNRRHIRTTGESFQNRLSDDIQDIIGEPDPPTDTEARNTPPPVELPKLMPTSVTGQSTQYITRSGRSVHPPKRLDL